MRLIDADAIAKEWGRYRPDIRFTMEDILIAIENRPTIDAVPVIRCKDCIRWRQSRSDITAKVCDWDGYEKTVNDYCSWAKRKDHELR